MKLPHPLPLPLHFTRLVGRLQCGLLWCLTEGRLWQCHKGGGTLWHPLRQRILVYHKQTAGASTVGDTRQVATFLCEKAGTHAAQNVHSTHTHACTHTQTQDGQFTTSYLYADRTHTCTSMKKVPV